jgi:hypothetical protein
MTPTANSTLPALRDVTPATAGPLPASRPAAVTPRQLVHADNDGFRNAFNRIAQEALPFMDPRAYYSDLLYDAAKAAALPVQGKMYLLVRSAGTNDYADPLDAIADCTARFDGSAVLRITRGMYDMFTVDVVFTAASGLR